MWFVLGSKKGVIIILQGSIPKKLFYLWSGKNAYLL